MAGLKQPKPPILAWAAGRFVRVTSSCKEQTRLRLWIQGKAVEPGLKTPPSTDGSPRPSLVALGFKGEQVLLMDRFAPFNPPMGALFPLRPGGCNHSTPDTADPFAALPGGEIGAAGAVPEQTDHQFLRESLGA